MLSRIIAALACVAALACMAPPAWAQLDGPLSIARQGSYFVGGRDVRSDSLSTLPAYAPSGTVSIDQVYVRFQEPVAATGLPLLLVHGCCLTGMTWETTPDGRMGWDEYFVRRGHPVHVMDQAWRGRSAAHPTQINPVRTGVAAPATLPTVFAAGREDAWGIFRFGPRFGESFSGMRFPLAAQAEFWKQMVPDWNFAVGTPNPSVMALNLIAQRLRRVVLVSHSQSGIYPFQAATGDRLGIAGIISIEPGTCPAATSDMAPYAGLPILVLWGDFVELSTRWAPRLAGCLDFARAANAAGGRVEVAVLPEMGIRGNSHMLMQDDNSHQIADWLVGWIARNVPPG